MTNNLQPIKRFLNYKRLNMFENLVGTQKVRIKKRILNINPNKAGLFERSVSWGKGGGGQFDPPSYFRKNLSNITITIQLLNNLLKICRK